MLAPIRDNDLVDQELHVDAPTIAPPSHRLDLHAPPPLVVLALGAAVAERLDPGAFSPDHIGLHDNGSVNVGRALPGMHWWAPERRAATAGDVDPDSVAAAMWTLGRFLLELALGRRLETAAVDAFDPTAVAVDSDGRTLPTRFVEVVGALLAADPAQRLQSTRAAARVCTEAAARFGDVDTALRVAARHRAMRSTADLPARDILSPGELVRLKQQTRAAGLDDITASVAIAHLSSSSLMDANDVFTAGMPDDLLTAHQLAAAMPAARDDDGNDNALVSDSDDVTLEGSPPLPRAVWIALALVALAIVIVIAVSLLT